MRKYRKVVLFAVLSLLAALYIFYNSFQPSESSNSGSKAIAEFVRPIVGGDGDLEKLHVKVRKLAHVVEFSVLGIFLGMMAESMREARKKVYICFPLLLALAVAVTDEFIQSFTGRTSKISDVLIDCSGAFSGILIVLLVAAVVWRATEKKHRQGA